MRSSYGQTLDRIRKKYDIWPWMEVANGTIAAGAPIGSFAPLAIQEAYPIIWNEMPFNAWAPGPGTADNPFIDLSIGGGLYNWWIGAQSSKLQMAQQQLATEDLVGGYNDRWVRLAKGAQLTKNEIWQAQWFLNQAIPGGGTYAPQVWQSLRGYRLYAKGSIDHPQPSRMEMIKSGKYNPRDYTYSGTCNVIMQTAAIGTPPLATNQLTLGAPQQLDCDFMVDAIRVRPQSPPVRIDGGGALEPLVYGFIPAVFVGIVPLNRTTAFQGGYGNQINYTLTPWQHWLGVDYNSFAFGAASGVFLPPVQRLDTQWWLEHPITVPNQERWNLNAQAIQLPAGFAGTYQMTMEFAFQGKLLIKK